MPQRRRHAILPRRAVLLAPAGAALLGSAALLAWYDHLNQQQDDQPGSGPGLLVGQRLPAFALPGLPGKPGVAASDVAAPGGSVLLNVFASWCVPCVQEMPVLLRLARSGLPIWGIDFRDKADDAATFLHGQGDPYQRVGRDEAGQTEATLSLAGLPQSFLLDRSGIVRWQWAGGLNDDAVARYLDPLLHR